ncbi:MAG: DUF4493 domain-containing protein [Bacteroides sp.]|nr:DUF4493 domain-containing protein [Bacteroides sp.]
MDMSLLFRNFAPNKKIKMKNLLYIIVSFLCFVLCGCSSDEPEFDDSTGKLIVHLQQDAEDDVDFSEYSVAIIPEQGFVPSALIKDIEWPVEVYVGTYTIAAASPKISETETTESWYYGEVKEVKIIKDRTTEITISLTLTEYPKSDL